MDFPLDDLLDENKSYQWLVNFFHNGEVVSPYSQSKNYSVNASRRAPIILYKEKITGQHFTLFTTTIFAKTHFKCSEVVLIIRGFLQGVRTAQVARELACDYQNLLELRHAFLAQGAANLTRSVLADEGTETDEVFQNAGEKGQKQRDLLDPPPRRGNKKKGTVPIEMTAHPLWEQSAERLEKCD